MRIVTTSRFVSRRRIFLMQCVCTRSLSCPYRPRMVMLTIATSMAGTAARVPWKTTSPSLAFAVVYLPNVSSSAGWRDVAHEQISRTMGHRRDSIIFRSSIGLEGQCDRLHGYWDGARRGVFGPVLSALVYSACTWHIAQDRCFDKPGCWVSVWLRRSGLIAPD
jgi:hypothetical protein